MVVVGPLSGEGEQSHPQAGLMSVRMGIGDWVRMWLQLAAGNQVIISHPFLLQGVNGPDDAGRNHCGL